MQNEGKTETFDLIYVIVKSGRLGPGVQVLNKSVQSEAELCN